MELFMRASLIPLLLFCFFNFAEAIPVPDTPKQEVGPVEIDFSPLAGSEDTKYKLHIVVRTENGATYKESFTTDGIEVAGMRNIVRASLESASGWKLKAVGNDKIVIEGHNDSLVHTVDIRVEGLLPNMAPTARRITKPEK